MELPEFPEGFTPEFLTALLQEQGLIEQSRVSQVRQERMGDGSGMMTEVVRLHLTFDGAADALPPSLVAKYPSTNPTNRASALAYNLHERETRYFAELDPLTPALTPRAFFADWQGDNFLILMQDLGEYRVGDQIEGADLADTELMLDELAKLHGTFWNRVDELGWVPHISTSYHADTMQQLSPLGWTNMCERFSDFLPPPLAALGDLFQSCLPALQAAMDRAPITFLHGDFRMENVLFGTRPEHQAIAIIDWQGPLLGKAMADVALMLAQSTRTEVRRSHERALIDRYLHGLSAQGITGYTPEQAWNDYQLAILYNWGYTSLVAGTLDVSNDRAFAWMSQMVLRQSAATEDHQLARRLEQGDFTTT